MLALIVERQIKLKIRVFSKINCHSICTYGSQNLSVSISHIRGLGALKQLTKVYYSFNNDYHYELSVSKPYKKKTKTKLTAEQQKKPTILSFLLMPKQKIMVVIIKTIMTMILIIMIIIIIIIIIVIIVIITTTVLMTEN